jgi:hypothetical protein
MFLPDVDGVEELFSDCHIINCSTQVVVGTDCRRNHLGFSRRKPVAVVGVIMFGALFNFCFFSVGIPFGILLRYLLGNYKL